MRNLALSAAVGATIFAGCGLSIAFDEPSVTGSGDVVTESRDVTTFDRIEVRGDFDVVVEAGAPTSVSITADDNFLPLIETRVVRRTLEIDTDHKLRSSRDVRIAIQVPELRAIHSSGSSDVVVRGVRGEDFDIGVSGSSDLLAEGEVTSITVSVSGSGEVRATGRAERVRAGVSGSGEIDLAEMPARSAAVHVSGSGEVDLAVAEELDATVSGSGEVHYLGNPRVRSHISGSGSVSGG